MKTSEVLTGATQQAKPDLRGFGSLTRLLRGNGWLIPSALQYSKSQIAHHASRFTFHVSRFTHHASRITLFISETSLSNIFPASSKL
ncbi:hypothetical protein QUF80_15445 [Desulfococcaceae bacterium HSG8]|nr:hypothetical protein [Desulfococcaceae bacterium HSG8]